MAQTTFSGPVVSTNGFVPPVTVTASLPAASSVAAGTMYIITDNGSGDDEYCLVISTGSAWVTAVGAALS
jgi:hypothetical protein